ncbi:MAG TPA: DUF6549 family protein [Candidatus Paceibacterota bacterium]
MTFLLKYWKQIGFIVIILLLFSSLYLNYYLNKENNRNASNWNIEATGKDQAIFIKNGELKQNYATLDSLRQVLGIRAKTIVTVFKTSYTYKDSTLLIPVIDNITYYDTIPINKQYEIKTACYDLSIIKDGDSVYSVMNWHDELTGFLSWERLHKIWFIHFGKKIYTLKIQSECQGKLIPVEKLIIQE